MPIRTHRSLAPGKVILSGEHAVVHGRPGLAMACDRHATVEVAPLAGDEILIELPDLRQTRSWSLKEAETRMEALCARHHAFLRGTVDIENVLNDPCELLLAAWLRIFQEFELPPAAARLHVSATIPPHAGLGSSAAVLVATLHAAGAALQGPLSLDRLAAIAADLESLRHGRSSGLDPTLCAYGGTLRFQKGTEPVRLNGGIEDLWLVQTGSPASSTGECVAQVGRQFAGDPIWEPFAEATHQMEAAWQARDSSCFAEAVRRNHELLVHIGVVPQAIAAFIGLAGEAGLTGKICGAGAIRGDAAGMVLLHGPKEAVASLCADHGYTAMPCVMEPQGVRDADS